MSIKKEIDYSYYIFWSCMVFLGSLVGIFILTSLIPKSIIYTVNQDIIDQADNQAKAEEEANSALAEDIAKALTSTGLIDAIRSASDAKTNTESNMAVTPDTSNSSGSVILPSPKNNRLQLPLGANAPVFINGNITPTGQFTNYRGTVFVAGILTYMGRYPNDFEQESNLQTTVKIELAFGWRALPNFEEIKKYNADKERIQIQLDDLAILDIKIQVQDIFDTKSINDIEIQLAKYMQSLFSNQLVPKRIRHLAQQRLAAAYIAKNHLKIELIPN